MRASTFIPAGLAAAEAGSFVDTFPVGTLAGSRFRGNASIVRLQPMFTELEIDGRIESRTVNSIPGPGPASLGPAALVAAGRRRRRHAHG